MQRKTLLFASLTLLAAGTFVAQAQRQRVSPHETVSATIGGKKVTIEYGRPSMKGRKIFGGLEPYDKVWRTGADEATTLTTEGDIMLGSLHVPAGTYALFTIPTQGDWTLVVNKTAKQMGAFNYDEKMDLGRIKMKTTKPSAPVETFTITVAATGGNNGALTLAWENAQSTIPIMMH